MPLLWCSEFHCPSLTGHLLVRLVLWCWHDSELSIDKDSSTGQLLSTAPVPVAMVTVAEDVVCNYGIPDGDRGVKVELNPGYASSVRPFNHSTPVFNQGRVD